MHFVALDGAIVVRHDRIENFHAAMIWEVTVALSRVRPEIVYEKRTSALCMNLLGFFTFT